jgi:cysteinyl-tRNA synthetase
MKLTELNHNRRSFSTKVLKEQYETSFNVDNMSMSSTRTMLQKVRGLLSESKQSPDYHNSQASNSYMKLVFMEQALSDHYNELRSLPQPRIMVENEEVEKSQVVLAAQDMVDQVQKMLEDVGQMQVKELPALVSSIESEIGVNESQTYNDQVSGQLDTLSASLKEVSTALKNALNGLTGQAVDAAFDAGADMGAEAGVDAGMDAGLDAGADVDADMSMGADMPPEEEPEMPPTGGVGRAKR